jgi:ribosomal protein S18 acetylase RimI-like enzyme
VIRAGKPGDLGWIISTHGSMYAREFGFNGEFEIDIARKTVSICEKKDSFSRLWIKEFDGEKVGSIAISTCSEKTAFLNFLIVLEDHRGKGIAGELMSHAISYAQTNGYESVRLETYSCLETARKLYANLGFKRLAPVETVRKYGQTFDREFWELDLHVLDVE